MTSLLVVTPDLSDNSTGRTYVWWLLAKKLGWTIEVVSFRGDEVWAPLRGSEFATICRKLPERTLPSRARRLAKLSKSSDVVVAVKPLPASLGVALEARRVSNFAMILDIDDPDLEVRLAQGNLLRKFLWRARYLPFWLGVRNFDRVKAKAAITVSNPVLQSRYGGTLIPHARLDPGLGRPHTSAEPNVAFVGTVRSHKGITVLREAVARVERFGVGLTITAAAPPDAQSWERWVGEGSVEEGESIVSNSDIVALPSLRTSFAEGQLPAKLIDAIIRGRVVIVSDIAPLPWAVGIPELCIRPGSVEDLATLLKKLCDPTLRDRFSYLLRQRALDEFSVDALAPRLPGVVEAAQRKADARRSGPRSSVTSKGTSGQSEVGGT